MRLNLKNNFQITIAHILLGFLLTFNFVPTLYGMGIILLGSFSIVSKKNANNEALLFSAYLVGAEVLLRMTSGVILYETGKYGVILFLVLGLWFGKNTNKPNVSFVFYLLLLLLGIAFTSVPPGESLRKSVAFNLSGPFTLGICAIYFYGRKYTLNNIFRALQWMLLPLVSMSAYLYLKTPDFSDISFSSEANFATSGGFGPNQVATALGLGIFILIVSLIVRKRFSGFITFDIIILIYLIYRGLLTFSRGGILTAGICAIAFILFYSMYRKRVVTLTFRVIIVSVIAGAAIFTYTSEITEGMLENRYTGKNAAGKETSDVSSGRLDIITEQFDSFMENPITGIGVGNGKYKRANGFKKVTAASHNEIGRLIEEHGLVGVLSLLLLFFSFGYVFITSNNLNRAFLTAFFLFWLLTVSHSAMRIAFPAFVYGLSLVRIENNEENSQE